MCSPPSRRMPRPVETSRRGERERWLAAITVAPLPHSHANGGRVGGGGTASTESPPTPNPSPPLAGGGNRPPPRLDCAQFHEAGQEAGQRLAGAGRRDQQHRAAGPRFRQKFQLMRARRPAAAREPADEPLGQASSWPVGRARSCRRVSPSPGRGRDRHGAEARRARGARIGAAGGLSAADAPARPARSHAVRRLLQGRRLSHRSRRARSIAR